MGKQRNPPLQDTVERTKKDYDEPKGLTMEFCAIEIYDKSDDYNGVDGVTIIQRIIEMSNEMKFQYSYIHHDRDFYKKNTFDSRKRLIGVMGQPKAPHYHMVIQFQYRVKLSDIALKFGVPDRFIKKLKGERDYDNMLVYLTHIKFDESDKTHYPIEDVHSSIFDYNRFLYDEAVRELELHKSNIIRYLIETLKGYPKYCTWEKAFSILEDQYYLPQITTNFRIIEKIVNEHNAQYNNNILYESVKESAQAQINNANMRADNSYKQGQEDLISEADVTGVKFVQRNGVQYAIYKTNGKENK